MKGRVLLFDEDARFRRAALVVDGRLDALEIDVLADASPRIGSVYRAKVDTIVPALGAAFLDMGGVKGFLPEAGNAKPGDILRVKVRREAEDGKAARASVQDRDSGAPGLIESGPNAFVRLIAQHGDAPRAADPAVADDIADALKTPAPFDHHDIESQIDALLDTRVDLAGGAWMTIQPTAALIAVDVNSGQATGGDALLRANLAAADALPRQLRMRRLGGAIAVDFAGGPTGKDRPRLDERIGGDLKRLGWGPAGWLELQRRKPGRSLVAILSATPDMNPT